VDAVTTQPFPLWTLSSNLSSPAQLHITPLLNRVSVVRVTAAAVAGVTVMVSKLTAFATTSPQPQGECIQVVNGAISGAKESLSKLGRLDAIGDDKVDAENPDLADMSNWIMDVNHNFTRKCRDGGGHVSAVAVAAGDSLSTAVGLVISARPYWDNSLPSPDGSGP
jgi:hypothetical protein